MTDPLEALRRQFLDRCRADHDRLAKLEPGEEEAALITHRLAGAAGAFGFPDLGSIAAEIDVRIRNGDSPCHQDLENLRRALAQAIDGDGGAGSHGVGRTTGDVLASD